jgi:hypothetical protein
MTSHPKRYAFQVTGDGHGGQPFGCQLFSLQPPEPGCQLPTAEKPTPELPMPVPVTRHHVFLPLPILNTPYSILSYLLFHRASEPPVPGLPMSAVFPLPPCHLASLPPRDYVALSPTGPLVNLSTCQLVASPYTQYSILDTLVSHLCTFARGTAAFAPLHGIFVSHAPMPLN